jgi:beta-glucanase (GH16 family)
MQLVWSDEFDGARVDAAKWSFSPGAGGDATELEWYTDGANARVDAGVLWLEARREPMSGRDYTSARLQTKGLASFTCGRFEVRARVPAGQGLWPAFWLLGDDVDTSGWPACGEIDVLENIGKEPGITHGSAHGPGYSGGKGLTATHALPGGAKLSDDFHTFRVDWEPGSLSWYVDDVLYQTRTPADARGSAWVFDHPFFLILNVAVGGAWPGNPDSTTTFPAAMKVDWVRVSQRR